MMVLAKRERILAVAAGALVLLVGGRMVLSAATGPIRDRRTRVEALTQQVEKKSRRFRNVQRARTKLVQWNRRSLPTDSETARLLYENWLLETVERAKFTHQRVESAEGRPHRGFFVTYPFTVRGQATFERLTKFLFDFYSAGHLHQVRRLSIKPVEKSSGFEVVIGIEAALLPTADRRDKLCDEPSRRLGKIELATFQSAIVGRNVFAPYSPPVTGPAPLDTAKFVYVTGITEKDGKCQVWLKARTTGEKFTLAEGEEFRVGAIQGTVKRIGQRDVELEIDGKSRVVSLGENLQSRKTPPQM